MPPAMAQFCWSSFQQIEVKFPMQTVLKEIAFFRLQAYSMRILLLTNMIYALVLPIIELFIGAYIIRNSSDFSLVMVFQLAQSTGIPLTFMINGFLLNRFPMSRLFACGMLLSAVSMATMMFQQQLQITGVSIAGFIMGISYGFFWANRIFLTLTTTKDEERNYYYGLETFFYTLSFIIGPSLAGSFIAASHHNHWFGGNINTAYYVLTGVVFLLTIAASWLAQRGRFRNPPRTRFLFATFHPLWIRMLRLATLKGIAQGYIITAPVMLVMKLVGEEGALGMIQSTGALLSAALLYTLGRTTSTKHRITIFAVGLSLFLAGAATNAALYSATGAIIFIACLVFARPLLDMAYYPLELGVIEWVSAREKRNQFAYIFSHELGTYIGRLFGCSLFILLARYAGEDVALRYALLVIALIQFISVWVARSIMRDKAWEAPAPDSQAALDKLKDPIAL